MTILISDAVRHIYNMTERAMMQRIGNQPVTCRRGCWHCCCQMTEMSAGEGIVIAEKIAGWPDIREWVRRLFTAARAATDPGITLSSHFAQSVPCVFLTPDRACAIYDVRPLVCRSLIVCSPVANCMPGAADPVVKRYAFPMGAFRALWDLDVQIAKDHPKFGLPGPAVATIAHMTLWALARLATRGSERHYVEKRLCRLPSVTEWTTFAASRYRKEGAL